jgi:hypothetical protein
MFLTRAYFEAGNDEKVWRALNWLSICPGGKAGAWFECHADRPVPPLPPLGIVPWTWAELAVFFVHHLLGVRPNKNELIIRPRLLSGLDKAKASLTLRSQRIDLTVTRAEKEIVAIVNGKRVPLVHGELKLPLPSKAQTIEMKI